MTYKTAPTELTVLNNVFTAISLLLWHDKQRLAIIKDIGEPQFLSVHIYVGLA